MTVFSPRDAGTFDPVDYERSCIRDRSHDLARFAEMVATLVDMRQDDRAHAMFGAVLEEIGHLKKHFTALARKLKEENSADIDAMRKRTNIAIEEAERNLREADAGAPV